MSELEITRREFVGQCYHPGSFQPWEDLFEEATPEQAMARCMDNDRRWDAHLFLDPAFGRKPPKYRVIERVVQEREIEVRDV